jgi:Rhs element Vgr protein
MSQRLPLDHGSDVVTLKLTVNGVELPRTLALTGVEIVRQVNRIPYARLLVTDGDPARGDFAHSSGDTFVPGHELSLSGGYQGHTTVLFTGVVLAQRLIVGSNRSQLEITCRDPAFRMTLSRRLRYFESVTDSDVAETLLAEYGLGADITATEATHPQLLQYQASDWDFMLNRLEANGQVVIVQDGTVGSVVPSLEGEPEVTLRYGATLLELDAQWDARSQGETILATAWDAATQDLQVAEAVAPPWESNGNLGVRELIAATDRQQDDLWHGGSLAPETLQAWADGALRRSRLAAWRGRARCQGLPGVPLGGLLAIAAVSDRINGPLYVSGVRHEFSLGNWLTDLEFGLPRQPQTESMATSAPPAAGLSPAVSGLQVGVVTQLADDPAGEHRIRVKIPIAGLDQTGLWARVATLDAGADRGTFFRPEVDDEVVLGFFHSDPAQPVVLGMLHSSAKAPPLDATDDNHQKTYVSRSGITLLFDDDQTLVSLTTPKGNQLTLSDADGGLVLADQNGNQLTMNSNGIELSSVKALRLVASTDLQGEGTNTEFTASASFKAEGNASADLTSSGALTIQGSLVQIN